MKTHLHLIRFLLVFAMPSIAWAGPEEEHALKAKASLEVIDLVRVHSLMTDLKKKSDDELRASRAELDKTRGVAHRNWRKTQAAAETLNVVTKLVELRWAVGTLDLYSISTERIQRIDAIHERENEECRKLYGEPFYSPLGPSVAKAWTSTPGHAQAREEEKRVEGWFVEEVRKKAREINGTDGSARRILDDMRRIGLEDSTYIDRAIKKIDEEMAVRRGELLRNEEDQKAVDEELKRHAMHLAPYRTEYEAKTGEVVGTMFQVYKGAPPYFISIVSAGGGGAWMIEKAESGDFTVPFTFREPGTYTPVITAFDAAGGLRSVSISIKITGDPIPPEKKPGDDSKDKKTAGTPDPQTPAQPGVSTIPIQGSFKALVWHANAQLIRWDLPDLVESPDLLKQYPVPITLTIDPDGHMHSKVRYELPASEMGKPSDPIMRNMFWKVSFDLEGLVDWRSGKVHVAIKNGHDETGYEKDVPKTDDNGKPAGFIGHWRDFRKTDYSMALEGWAIPGPQAGAWLASLKTTPQAIEQAKKFDFENIGLPALLISNTDQVAFRDRGFFGMSGIDGSAAKDGMVPRRVTYSLSLHHTGYDGLNETEEDQTQKEQARADENAKSARGGWYIKLLGLTDPPPADTPVKDDDLLAYGLWPTKPITIAAGSTMSARAMGVFGKNVTQAVDLSERSKWTSSPGLTLLGGGTFRADQPGDYTVTAMFTAPDGPMSSTIKVTVAPAGTATASFAKIAPAETIIKGTVQSVSSGYVTASTDASTMPAPGDKADIYFKIPGDDDEITVANGKVVEITGAAINVQIESTTGTVAKNHLIRFHSKVPVSNSDAIAQNMPVTPTGKPTGAVNPPAAVTAQAEQEANAAMASYMAGDYKSAVAGFSKLIDTYPANPGVYYNRGLAHLQLKAWDDVIKDANKSLELGNANPSDVYCLRGSGWAGKGNTEIGALQKALADHSEAIRLNPKNALAFNNRANDKLMLKDFQGSLADANASIAVDPASPLPYYNKGYAHFYLGDFKQAIATWESAIKMQPAYQAELGPMIERLKGFLK